jgi:hypothetical protein
MVDESAYTALFRGVDVLRVSARRQEADQERNDEESEPHLVTLQHHEIEMPDPVIGIQLHTFPKRLFRDHFSYIFVYQASTVNVSDGLLCLRADLGVCLLDCFIHSLGYVFGRPQPKTLHLGLHDIYLGILPLSKSGAVSPDCSSRHMQTGRLGS